MELRMERKGAWPLSADVAAHILRVQAKHADLVKVRIVGRSVQKRPIYAVTVTDPRRHDEDKQHVLIAGGHHGNEESGRMVALALLDWLVTRPAEETVAKQKIVIMPCVNPDGAETNSYLNVNRIKINYDFVPDRPTRSPEARALKKVARALQPEVFVDLHAAGGVGCGVDMVLFPWTRDYTEDARMLHRMAEDMAAAGEKAGIPQLLHPLTWHGWGGPGRDSAACTLWHYDQFKSIVFMTENTESDEHAYPWKLRARAGLAKLKALLAWGNRRHPRLPYEGYPCMLACSMFDRGVVAFGETAARRRASRVAIWSQAAAFRRINYRLPQPCDRKVMVLDYQGALLRDCVGLQSLVQGRREVKRVTLDGRRVGRTGRHGFVTWHAGRMTFVMVPVPELKRGEHEMAMVFE